MRLISCSVPRHVLRQPRLHAPCFGQRHLSTVLAIETSCDDTSVALVEADLTACGTEGPSKSDSLRVLFHERITSNNDAYHGIHPLKALASHISNLASLVEKALRSRAGADLARASSEQKPKRTSSTPDLVSVTRGPGMRSNLSVGLDTAKGLAVAWDRPLIGVHHMMAHALTPRLVSALVQDRSQHGETITLQPRFPFLTVLASGGHTMLIDSTSLTDHALLAETQDIALGNLIDHAATCILPPGLLKTPYGRALEEFAFGSPNVPSIHSAEENAQYDYDPPPRRQEELERRVTDWGWSLGPPLAESKGGRTSRRMVYSFAGLLSSVERFMNFKLGPYGHLTRELRNPDDISLAERQSMAREVQRIAFEHLASRILLHLGSVGTGWAGDTIVVSGGVASNMFLRHVLRSILDVRGYSHIKLSFPPAELCTDNALMIAWAGIEMYRAGYTSDLSIGPLRKWSMDPAASDGGILGVDGWKRE